MKKLVLRSWVTLLSVDVLMRLRGFQALYRKVRKEQIGKAASPNPSSDVLCHAMNLACVFYYRTVSSLERSAATTLMLRRHGWSADMVIGVQIFPMDSYTWVEIEGRIVNDEPDLTEIYQVLERC